MRAPVQLGRPGARCRRRTRRGCRARTLGQVWGCDPSWSAPTACWAPSRTRWPSEDRAASADLSISLGEYNLIGGLVLAVVGMPLLARPGARGRARVVAAGPRRARRAGRTVAARPDSASPTRSRWHRHVRSVLLRGRPRCARLRRVGNRTPDRGSRYGTSRHEESRSTRPDVLLARVGSAPASFLAACGRDRRHVRLGPRKDPLAISAIPDQDPELLNRLYPRSPSGSPRPPGLKVLPTGQRLHGRRPRLRDRRHPPGLDGRADRRPGPVRVCTVRRRSRSGTSTRTSTAFSSPTRAPGSSPSMMRRDCEVPRRPHPDLWQRDVHLRPADAAVLHGRGRPRPGRPQGGAGFSGSHDATIEVVATGSFEVGAVNEQVWDATVEAGEVELLASTCSGGLRATPTITGWRDPTSTRGSAQAPAGSPTCCSGWTPPIRTTPRCSSCSGPRPSSPPERQLRPDRGCGP